MAISAIWIALGILISLSNFGWISNFPLNGSYLFGYPAYLTGYYLAGLAPLFFGLLLLFSQVWALASWLAQRFQVVVLSYSIMALASALFDCISFNCNILIENEEWIEIGWLKIIAFATLFGLAVLSENTKPSICRLETVVYACIGCYLANYPALLMAQYSV